MPFFNCDPCKRSFPAYASLVMHYNTGVHRRSEDDKDAVPAKEDCQTDSVPAGYELRLPKETVTKRPPTPPSPPPDPAALADHPENHTSDEHAPERGNEAIRRPDRQELDREETRRPSDDDRRGRRETGQDDRRDDRREPENDDRRHDDRRDDRGRRRPLYWEPPDPNEILETMLMDTADMPDSAIHEIMGWAHDKGSLDAQQVQWLLTKLTGVPKSAIELLPLKYAAALAKVAQSGGRSGFGDINPLGPGMDAFGGMNPMFGGMSPMFGNPRGNPMFGNPLGGGGMPGFDYRMRRRYDGGGYPSEYEDDEEYRPRRRQFSDRGREAPQADPNVARLEGTVARLQSQIEELTVKKKEDQLNERLDRMESSITALLNGGGGRNNHDDEDPQAKAIATQIAELKQEITETKNSRLEEKLVSLEAQFNDAKNERLTMLQEQIKDLKDMVKNPTGRTDMDVVGDVTKQVLDTMKSAGNDIKAFALKEDAKKDFAPDRVPVDRRVKIGSELAANMEKEARVVSAEDTLMAMGKE